MTREQQKAETAALHRIYYNINHGFDYGEYIHGCNPAMPEPFFYTELETYNGLIRWRHYGSSANRNTIKDLKWIITTIFRTTPTEFEKNYIAFEY